MAIGNLKVENYIPVVRLNKGIKSAYPAALGAGTTIGGSAVVALGTITSTSANALAVGRQGTTGPAFNVDSSIASQADGLNVKGAAAGSGVAVSTITTGTNAPLTIDSAGNGTITIAGTSTGNIVLGTAMTGVSSSYTGGSTFKSGTAVPASTGALAAGAPITMFSTGIKIWVTSDTPAFSATKGDLAINTGGSSSSTRLFINNGTTNWVAVTTAS